MFYFLKKKISVIEIAINTDTIYAYQHFDYYLSDLISDPLVAFAFLQRKYIYRLLQDKIFCIED